MCLDPQQKCILRRQQGGFTFVEMIVVMVITGILGGIVALLLRGPVQGYVDSAQRADMTDIADTAMHRLTRDVRLALPNSVRRTSNGGKEYLEYLEMVAGGRYNTDATPCFDAASMVGVGVSCLTTVGDLVSGAAGSSSSVLANGRGTIAASAVVIVNNPGNDCAASSVYCGYGNGYGSATIVGVTNSGVNADEDVINFAATVFPPSPNKRFQIVNTPVTYVCDPVAGTLTRYWGYAIQSAQPNDIAALPLSTASHALLATHVSSCSFAITPVVEASAQSAVLVSMPLTITERAGTEQAESVSLYGVAHVSSEAGLYGAANGNVP